MTLNTYDKSKSNSVCRICLTENSELVSIFRPKRIDEQIFYCTNIMIDYDASLPESICGSCTRELNASTEFKRKCEASDELLKRYVASAREEVGEDKPINNEFNLNNVDLSDSDSGDLKKTEIEAAPDKLDAFACKTCGLRCQNRWVLKIHMRTHSGERPYQCDVCSKRFVSNSNMRMHRQLMHNDDRQVCSECGKSFSCLAYLKRHSVVHSTVKPYGCTVCEKRFNTKSYLKEHIARHTGDKRFFCEICASMFISDVNLKQHMLVHGIQNRNFKRHQCTFCEYKTMGKVDLARHVRKHTGEKPFHCPHDGCKSAFAGKASLKLHIRIHTGEKPYACKECPAKFSRGDKFKDHMLKKHNITEVGPSKRSRLVVKELAEAAENGQPVTIPIDVSLLWLYRYVFK